MSCVFTISQKHNSRVQYRKYNMSKDYKCQFCYKMFKNSGSLATHRYRYHPYTPRMTKSTKIEDDIFSINSDVSSSFGETSGSVLEMRIKSNKLTIDEETDDSKQENDDSEESENEETENEGDEKVDEDENSDDTSDSDGYGDSETKSNVSELQ